MKKCYNIVSAIRKYFSQVNILLFILIPVCSFGQKDDCTSGCNFISNGANLMKTNLDSAYIIAQLCIDKFSNLKCPSTLADCYKLAASIKSVQRNFNLALDHGNKAELLYSEDNNLEGLARVELVKGSILINLSKYNDAIKILNNSKNYFALKKDTIMVCKIIAQLGSAYSRVGDFTKSIELYLESVKYLELSDKINDLALVYNNLAATYANIENWDKAKEYYKKSILIFEKTNDSLSIATSTLNLAELYSINDSFDILYEYLIIGKDIVQKKNYNNLYFKIEGLYAHYFIGKQDYAKAEKHAKLRLDYALKSNMPNEILNANIAIAEVYRYWKKFNLEIKQYTKIMNEFNEDYELKSYYTQCLSEAYAANGDYKNAYIKFLEVQSMKDSMFSIEKHTVIQDLETKYETEKKEAEIARQKLELRNKNLGLGLMGSLLLAIAGIAYYLFQSRKKEKEVSQFLDFQNEGLRNSNFNLSSALQSLKKKEQQEEEQEMEIVISNGYNSKVKLKDILYIEAENNLLKIYLVDGTIRHDYQRLKSFAELLLNSQLFIQIHRSYIVNKMYIVDRRANGVRMQNDVQIPIGITYKEKFNLSMKGE